VHSVVSWDFAVSLLPGWHTTIFAPYFVAGAIHSGLAMVFTLMIPMRRLLRLERLVTIDHLEKMAQTLLVTTAIIGYTYVIEPFIAWYSGDIFEGQFALWRATTWGRGLTWMYWSLFLFNVFIPLSLLARRARRSLTWLFIVSIAINIGMFFERLHIVPASMAHDFMPHNWGAYMPTWVEFSITAGTASFFFSLFLLFSKLLPTIPLTDLKGHDTEESGRSIADCKAASKPLRAGSATWVLAVFGEAEKLLQAARSVCEQGFRSEVFTPVKMPELHRILRHRKSPVRFWTLAGALFGVTAGFSLAIGAASVNHLIVGGKPPVALIPYVIIGFEMMVLFGSLFNLAGLLNHTRMLRQRPHPAYDRRFSRDKFGLLVECGAEEIDKVRQIMAALAPEETHVQR
jgi:molybdopterin-containing oxidoreductase family membrane subunit